MFKKKKQTNKQKVKKNRFSFLYLFLFLIFTSTILITGFNLISKAELFRIKHINVEGQNRFLEDEIIRIAGVNYGDNLFALNLKFIRENIKADSWIKEASITKVFPDTLKIEIVERKPFALVKIQNSYFIIDETGKPFKVEDEKVSSITVIENIPFDDITLDEDNGLKIKDSKYYTTALDILKIAQKEDFVIQKKSVKKIIVSENENLKLIISNGQNFSKVKEVIVACDDYVEKMNDLDYLYNKLKNKQNFMNISKIDLSYNVGILVKYSVL